MTKFNARKVVSICCIKLSIRDFISFTLLLSESANGYNWWPSSIFRFSALTDEDLQIKWVAVWTWRELSFSTSSYLLLPLFLSVPREEIEGRNDVIDFLPLITTAPGILHSDYSYLRIEIQYVPLSRDCPWFSLYYYLLMITFAVISGWHSSQ